MIEIASAPREDEDNLWLRIVQSHIKGFIECDSCAAKPGSPMPFLIRAHTRFYYNYEAREMLEICKKIRGQYKNYEEYCIYRNNTEFYKSLKERFSR